MMGRLLKSLLLLVKSFKLVEVTHENKQAIFEKKLYNSNCMNLL